MGNLEIESVNEKELLYSLKVIVSVITTNIMKDYIGMNKQNLEMIVRHQYNQLIDFGFSPDKANYILELCLKSFE